MDYVAEIKKHAVLRRRFKGWSVGFLKSPLWVFFEDRDTPTSSMPGPDEGGVKKISEEGDEVILEAQSVYTKPPAIMPEQLEETLGFSIPEAFKEIYRSFGEVLFVTRAAPVRMMSIESIIAEYQNLPYRGEIERGRFFRFADYPGESDPMFYGLRKNEATQNWEVTLAGRGILYDQMAGPEGRDWIVAPSFECWLEERWLERDGKPDYFALRVADYASYMEAIPKNWKDLQ